MSFTTLVDIHTQCHHARHHLLIRGNNLLLRLAQGRYDMFAAVAPSIGVRQLCLLSHTWKSSHWRNYHQGMSDICLKMAARWWRNGQIDSLLLLWLYYYYQSITRVHWSIHDALLLETSTFFSTVFSFHRRSKKTRQEIQIRQVIPCQLSALKSFLS